MKVLELETRTGVSWVACKPADEQRYLEREREEAIAECDRLQRTYDPEATTADIWREAKRDREGATEATSVR